jgi:hypothetical protein
MPKQSAIEIFKDKDRQFRFRIKAPNGEIIATGEAYKTKQACQDTLKVLGAYVTNAKVKDLTT